MEHVFRNDGGGCCLTCEQPDHTGPVQPEQLAATGDWMQTYTGRTFYPLAPNPDDVDIEDIAHALSMICRFGGHTKRWYSVAEHAVLISYAVPPEDAPWGLFHDGGETYVGDMVRPLKYALPAYRAAEDDIQAAIAAKFGLTPECPASVKTADRRILRDERDALMLPPTRPWVSLEQVEALGVPIVGWPPAEAKRLFLDRWSELTDATFHASRRMSEPVA